MGRDSGELVPGQSGACRKRANRASMDNAHRGLRHQLNVGRFTAVGSAPAAPWQQRGRDALKAQTDNEVWAVTALSCSRKLTTPPIITSAGAFTPWSSASVGSV